MSDKLFDIDPATKLGAADNWEDGDEFAAFVDSLNRGTRVRGNGVSGLVESTDDFSLDAATLAELKSKLAGYR